MRKFILLLIAVLGISLGLAAQTLVADNPTPNVIDYQAMITTLGGFALGVMAVVGAIKRLLPGLHGLGTQVVSWVVAIIAALILWWLQVGMFAGLVWYVAVLYGLGGGLIANGLADVGLVQWFIGLFTRK